MSNPIKDHTNQKRTHKPKQTTKKKNQPKKELWRTSEQSAQQNMTHRVARVSETSERNILFSISDKAAQGVNVPGPVFTREALLSPVLRRFRCMKPRRFIPFPISSTASRTSEIGRNRGKKIKKTQQDLLILICPSSFGHCCKTARETKCF